MKNTDTVTAPPNCVPSRAEKIPPPDSRGRRIAMFPLTRIILAFLIIGIAALIGQSLPLAIQKLLLLANKELPTFISQVLSAAFALSAYRFFVLLLERRSPSEMDTMGLIKELGTGLALGAGIMTAVVGILWLAGSYHVIATNPVSILLPIIGISIISGVVEEILFRGIIFRITEESMGTIFALIVSSAIFGFLHAANPGATWFSSLAIALEAGLLLGMTFVLTRRLWLSVGVHAGWNFTQGGIFGVPVSGTTVKGLLVPRITGPEWLTGGAFGAEASVIAILICLSTFAVLTFFAARHSYFIKPFWNRTRPSDRTHDDGIETTG
jgi:hypothetical protein